MEISSAFGAEPLAVASGIRTRCESRVFCSLVYSLSPADRQGDYDSLNPEPARYRERFCTLESDFVGKVKED